ncbi:uncharacterized protein B0I36DRAFT_355136 [Microdochium trichocladiopsis]|uniref:Uncharacterized protein n=1 Tax=Microdochium trichocladiopsis TaxID=1682393 RepID=A0A9P8XWE7_9PEZI|nr:uncharacterized protein B0I36DRAFT_355136 [Microdochium trichocladiopsis]KAH7016326.1 hypothetical protein B0I36DRAFT_355136 [Microdochium trichocladiopsis]
MTDIEAITRSTQGNQILEGVLELAEEAKTHEIILVHGFVIAGNTDSSDNCEGRRGQRTYGLHEGLEYAQARRILEEWTRDSAEALQEPVVVRCMTINTTEVLEHGKEALCSAPHFLSPLYSTVLNEPLRRQEGIVSTRTQLVATFAAPCASGGNACISGTAASGSAPFRYGVARTGEGCPSSSSARPWAAGVFDKCA